MKKTNITATDFDSKFDAGEDITDHLDLSKGRRYGLDIKRVNVDFPAWMVEGMDKEAARLGIPRQAVIKIAVDHLLRNSA